MAFFIEQVKKRHTLKVQVVVDKTTEQIICANAFNGKAHDLTIFKQTLKVNPSIQILADSGYRGIQKVHNNTLYPLKHKQDFNKLNQDFNKLNQEQIILQKQKNNEISSKRMKVEHIIGRIKRFNILSNIYRNRRKRFGLRLNLICGIVNHERRLAVVC